LTLITSTLIAAAHGIGTQSTPDLLLLNTISRTYNTILLTDSQRALIVSLTPHRQADDTNAYWVDVDGHAIWLPDGQHIVFRSNRDGNHSDIYLMTAFGRAVRRLTTSEVPYFNDMPAPAPDGRRIAYLNRLENRAAIYVLDAFDPNAMPIRITEYEIMTNQRPMWTADGRQIAFSALRGAQSDVFFAEIPAAAELPVQRAIVVRPLEFTRAYDVAPAPSPHDGRIAFLSDRETILTARLMPYLYDPADESTRLLNITPDSDFNALTWRPDATQLIALEYPRTGAPPRVIRIDPATGALDVLLDGTRGVSSPPAWSPDGRQFAVSAFGAHVEDWRLLIVDTTTDAIRAIPLDAQATSVVWRPT
jgi:Tol biopolymer transport system component